ncbi:hypothetical protein [Staphylococcus aureus]|uniref:hypothetical protein n=1 Tax=Staphylococcus aureus TaxID=1280 RepID=UPI0020BFD417|nr:hypothetical protein [Staphylococcus aureus]
MKIEIHPSVRPEPRRKTLKTRIESVIRQTIKDDADHPVMGQIVQEIEALTNQRDTLESKKYERISDYIAGCIEAFESKGENNTEIAGFNKNWFFTRTLEGNLYDLRNVAIQLKHEFLLEEQSENKHEFMLAHAELTEHQKQYGILINQKYNHPGAGYHPGSPVDNSLYLYENLVKKARERFEKIMGRVGRNTSEKWMQEIAESKAQQELDIT